MLAKGGGCLCPHEVHPEVCGAYQLGLELADKIKRLGLLLANHG